MKAIVWTKYGSPDGLVLREVAKPVPKEDEILIRVRAATAATPDAEFRRMKLPFPYGIFLRLYIGVFRPVRITILGTEFAGEVESVGSNVTRFRPGDAVYGYTGLSLGTYTEYLCLKDTPSGLGGVTAIKPANLPFAEAAALPFGGLEALHAVRQAKIQSGDTVLIVGAGGSIGSYAVQLAKHHGAEVTGVDKAGKLEMLRSIGADYVINYALEDFTKNGQTYDVILDTISKSNFSRSIRSLNKNGAYINARPGLFGKSRAQRELEESGKRIISWSAGYSTANLDALRELVEAGTVKPVIDRVYPLESAAEAHRYVDSGEKKGNVVIVVG